MGGISEKKTSEVSDNPNQDPIGVSEVSDNPNQDPIGVSESFEGHL